MTDVHLFDPGPGVTVDEPASEPISATRRLTLRNAAALAQGHHPATGELLDNRGETCGTCAHMRSYRLGPKRIVHKCVLHHLGESHSASSDIRVSWPACRSWVAA